MSIECALKGTVITESEETSRCFQKMNLHNENIHSKKDVLNLFLISTYSTSGSFRENETCWLICFFAGSSTSIKAMRCGRYGHAIFVWTVRPCNLCVNSKVMQSAWTVRPCNLCVDIQTTQSLCWQYRHAIFVWTIKLCNLCVDRCLHGP